MAEVWFLNGCAILGRFPVYDNNTPVTYTNEGPNTEVITEIYLHLDDFQPLPRKLPRPYTLRPGETLTWNPPLLW